MHPVQSLAPPSKTQAVQGERHGCATVVLTDAQDNGYGVAMIAQPELGPSANQRGPKFLRL
jgi:hypothetical protein